MTMPRLSRPLAALQDHYTVVVVGSGYGGAIMASRLARAGQLVCLLERGRELHPGEFPRTTDEAAEQMQVVDGSQRIGDRRNLYNFHVGKDLNVFSGCGLGGTSLVNANVALRPTPEVMADERWPDALRADSAGLADGFQRAEEMLCPTTYPDSYPPLDKVAQLRRSAQGARFALTPINVTFSTGPNRVGVHQEACNGCGDCVTGCNYGSKNTLLMNYLPDAVHHGAEVFTEIEVRWIERDDDGWIVRYQPLGIGRDGFDAPPLPLRADIVVVSAGTLGSNGILLRSRARGLAVSDTLGERFTGNGDMLGYSYGLKDSVHGIGAGPAAPNVAHPAGPCITSVIDDRENTEGRPKVVIEDATIPGALAPLVPGMLASQILPAWLRGKLPHGAGPIALIQSALTRGRTGSITRMQTFLLMGLDDDAGRVVLDGDRVRVDWPGCGTRPFAVQADARMATAATASGGRYLHNPIYDRTFHHEVVTVHPLGGCVMADGADRGVVDHKGRVFSGSAGTDTYDGLYVADGSVIPVPAGVNPLLTISAIAERTAALAAADRGWTIDYSFAAVPTTSDGSDGPTEPPTPPTKPGLRFTEKMSGGFALGNGGHEQLERTELDPYLAAEATGDREQSTLTFVLTMSTDDVQPLLARLDAPMVVAGSIECAALSPEPLTVSAGQFNLFAQDDADPNIRHMLYQLPMEDVDGSRYHLFGYKVIQPGTSANAWADLTTLYTTVRRGDANGPVVGRGVLHIAPADFRTQLRTMATTGPVGAVERLEILAKLGEHFSGVVFGDYLHIVQPTSLLRRHAPPRTHRALAVPPPSLHRYRSGDGLDLRLTRYQGGTRGPVVLSHGAGANPLTFTTDTIATNTVEYLVANGFDVWVQEWRGSTLLPTCRGNFDADMVARFDHPAAEQYIRTATGHHGLHWVAHCIGSLTLMMSTLSGTVTPSSVLASSVAMHPIGPRIMGIKARLHLATLLRRLGIRHLTTDAYDDEAIRSRMFDQALRLYPIPAAERCDEAVCRRLAFIYGNAIHHAAVDERTHHALHELFGPTNLRMMEHLSNCAAAERLIDANGADTYLPHLEWLQFPITFLHGVHNLVWVPESTERSFDLLVREFGADNYRRVLLPNHGHQDAFMGMRSAEDAFPEMLAHLDRVNA